MEGSLKMHYVDLKKSLLVHELAYCQAIQKLVLAMRLAATSMHRAYTRRMLLAMRPANDV